MPWGFGFGFGRGWGRGRGFGATLGYCPWTGLPRGWRWFMPYGYGYPYNYPAYYPYYGYPRYPWWW